MWSRVDSNSHPNPNRGYRDIFLYISSLAESPF